MHTLAENHGDFNTREMNELGMIYTPRVLKLCFNVRIQVSGRRRGPLFPCWWLLNSWEISTDLKEENRSHVS